MRSVMISAADARNMAYEALHQKPPENPEVSMLDRVLNRIYAAAGAGQDSVRAGFSFVRSCPANKRQHKEVERIVQLLELLGYDVIYKDLPFEAYLYISWRVDD